MLCKFQCGISLHCQEYIVRQLHLLQSLVRNFCRHSRSGCALMCACDALAYSAALNLAGLGSSEGSKSGCILWVDLTKCEQAAAGDIYTDSGCSMQAVVHAHAATSGTVCQHQRQGTLYQTCICQGRAQVCDQELCYPCDAAHSYPGMSVVSGPIQDNQCNLLLSLAEVPFTVMPPVIIVTSLQQCQLCTFESLLLSRH